jgi:predicted transcriptional regulator
MEVVQLLWKLAPASVRQIHEALPPERAMDFATVQTYLRRLEAKGYAKSTLEGRVRIYSAKTKARTVIRQTVDDLVNRLFAGDTMPLMRHLIEERGIDEHGLAELRAMLDRLEKEGSDT